MLFNSGNPALLGFTRFLVGDPATAASPQYTDQEVKDAINVAYFEMLGKVGGWSPDTHVKTATVDSVASQQLYALPSDFTWMKEVLVDYEGNNLLTGADTSAKRLNNVDHNLLEANYRASASSIWLYSMHHEHFEIYPAVTTAGTNSVQITYGYEPAALSGDTDPPVIIPTQFHQMICYLAATHLKAARDLSFGQLYNRYLFMEKDFTKYFALRQREGELQFRNVGMDLNFTRNTRQGRVE